MSRSCTDGGIARDTESVTKVNAEPERIHCPIFDISFRFELDNDLVLTLDANEHFALNTYQYLVKSPYKFYFPDKGSSPPFLSMNIQCYIGDALSCTFQFGPNDILNVKKVCFAKRQQWTQGLDFNLLTEDDMEFRFYCTVFHDKKSNMFVLSELAYVFPHPFT